MTLGSRRDTLFDRIKAKKKWCLEYVDRGAVSVRGANRDRDRRYWTNIPHRPSSTVYARIVRELVKSRIYLKGFRKLQDLAIPPPTCATQSVRVHEGIIKNRRKPRQAPSKLP